MYVPEVLNVRGGPGTNYDKLGMVYANTTLDIIGTSGDWYKVSVTVSGEKITGYGHKDYIKIGTYAPPSSDEPDDPEKEKLNFAPATIV